MKPLAPAISTRTDNTLGIPPSTAGAKYGRLKHEPQRTVSACAGLRRRREPAVHGGAGIVRADREPSSGGPDQWSEPVDPWPLGGAGARTQLAPHDDGIPGASRDVHRLGHAPRTRVGRTKGPPEVSGAPRARRADRFG